MALSKIQIITLALLVFFFLMVLLSLGGSGLYYDKDLNNDPVKNNERVKEFRHSMEAIKLHSMYYKCY